MVLWSDLRVTAERNCYISSLDPLSADIFVSHLPEMNASGDVSGIIHTTDTLISRLKAMSNLSPENALASVRDLGIFAGSIKKHGIEPVDVIPELDSIFVQLGQMTGMLPRDTLFHYTLWNPDGDRQRRYTHFVDEAHLITCIKLALPRLERAIYDLTILYQIPIDAEEFVPQCQICEESLGGIVEAIAYTIRHVSRRVFAQELRPFFDAIAVQGKSYLGPGALDMPLFVFDHILWSAECREDFYLELKQSLLPYTLPIFRELYAQFEQHPSLLKIICQDLKRIPVTQHPQAIEGAKALSKLFDVLLKFRKPHMKVAKDAYHKCCPARDMGSGGYDLTLLIRMSELTVAAQQQLLEVIHRVTLAE